MEIIKAQYVMWALILIAVIILTIVFVRKNNRKQIDNYKLPDDAGVVLNDKVAFYRGLDEDGKKIFRERMRDFLSRTAVNGAGDVTVTDLDRLLVAASAIIPIFSFKDWRYNNISEVLLYKGAFNKQYEVKGADRLVLGLVGNGAMQGQMILSQPALRAGFQNPVDGHNTAIHEFVHLIDKADGAVDGVPEYLLSQPHIQPWIKYMHDTINEMRTSGHSDINLYGATNDAEFFAVVSEYYFERPDELRKKHPEVYNMMKEMFQSSK